MKVYNPADIGDRNKLSILHMIKNHDGISRQEISKRLHLSAPAVSNNVTALIEKGIIYETGCDDTSLGRKPRQLSYKGDLYYVISVELMPKTVRGGIADLYGNVLYREEKEISLDHGAEGVLIQLEYVIDKLIEDKNNDVEIIAIAVGVPALTGQNDLNDLFSTYLEDWKNVDLEEFIYSKYGVKAIIVNDVELALMGEREKGDGKDQQNILYIKYGDGFAARAIVDGYLLKGHNMAAGELGYYAETEDELKEGFVCPGRLERDICDKTLKEYVSSRSIDLIRLEKLAADGDSKAAAIVQRIIHKIAVVIANTVLMLNSEIVILGGMSGAFTQQNLNAIKAVLEKICPFVPEVVVSKLGVNASVIGGVKAALDYAEEQIVMLWK